MKRVIKSSLNKNEAKEVTFTLPEVVDFLSLIPELKDSKIDIADDSSCIELTIGNNVYTLVGAL